MSAQSSESDPFSQPRVQPVIDNINAIGDDIVEIKDEPHLDTVLPALVAKWTIKKKSILRKFTRLVSSDSNYWNNGW